VCLRVPVGLMRALRWMWARFFKRVLVSPLLSWGGARSVVVRDDVIGAGGGAGFWARLA